MIQVNFKAELRSVTVREYTKKDGSKGFAYPMMIETNDSSYTLNGNVDVYNAYAKGDLKKGMMCDVVANYEPRFQYNNFNVVSVVSMK